MATPQQYTIDVGIDLGTTNSAIAVVVDGSPLIVENNSGQGWTPSAVRITPDGTVRVGKTAYAEREFRPDEVAVEFKRWMGTEERFTFGRSGISKSAPELSAEILKSVRGDVVQRLGFSPAAAVVTVPAAFGLAQCQATQDAARLAGLGAAPLLQEPVAASLAYGYSLGRTEGTWLVYDLGGGTFDLALVGIRDGQIQVLDHEGDNFLGGKDMDWLIVEQMLVPALAERYRVESFARSNATRRSELAQLKAKAEEAKIELSRAPSVVVTLESGRQPLLDDGGKEIEADFTLRAEDYERCVQDHVARTIRITRLLLSRHAEVRPETILLVGGPTLTPLIRRQLVAELGIPVDTSANPLTVVAAGAALYAATQPRSGSSATSSTRAVGVATAVFRVPAVSDDELIPAGCTIDDPSAATVELSAADGSWSSGAHRLRSQSAIIRIPLPRAGRHEFRARFADETGSPIHTSPEGFVVHRGLTASAAPLSRSLGVVVWEDGLNRKAVEWILRKDMPLPGSKSVEFRTTRALDPHGATEVMSVYIVEGEARKPERNRPVGRIDIVNTMMERFVPQGSPIEVTISVDTSRIVTAKVNVVPTDQIFEVNVEFGDSEPTPRDLTQMLLLEQNRITDLTPTLSGQEVRELEELASQARGASLVATEVDPGARQQALSRLLELQNSIDEKDARFDWPRAVEDAHQELDLASETITAFGAESHSRRLQSLGDDLKAAERKQDLAELEHVASKIGSLRFEVLATQGWFWKQWFDYLADENRNWRDEGEAAALIAEGRRQVFNHDESGLRNTTLRLSGLATGDAGSFSNVALRRK